MYPLASPGDHPHLLPKKGKGKEKVRSNLVRGVSGGDWERHEGRKVRLRLQIMNMKNLITDLYAKFQIPLKIIYSF
jgi:hypothetical protein